MVVFASASITLMTEQESWPPFPAAFIARKVSRAMLAAGRDTPTSSANLIAPERSLYILFTEKWGAKSCLIILGPRVSIAPVRAQPTEVISTTFMGSMPDLWASTRA